MKRRIFLGPNSVSSQMLTAVLLTILFLITASVQTISAEPVEPIDSCIGVDHPPFLQPYAGDGYSYLRLGLTMPLEYYDEGSEFTGELSGSGNTVASSELLDANGQLFFNFPLYSYGSYDVMVYDYDGEMVFQSDVTVDDSEPECSPEALEVSPPRTTTVEEPEEVTDTSTETIDDGAVDTSDNTVEDSSGTSTEDTSEEGSTVEETSDETDKDDKTDTTDDSSEISYEDSGGFIWWPLILVVIGLPLILIGLWNLFKKTCEKERKAWLAASERAAAASDKARKAEDEAEKASDAREQLEDELDEIRETYPSAGREGGEEAWIEMDGKRITSRDVAMRREAERAAWNKYRSNRNSETAEELQEDWEEAATPQSEEERRELDDKAKGLEKAIKEAKKAEKEAKEKAKEAQEAEQEANRKADEARRIYEACMKAALAPPKPKPEPKPDPTPGTTEGPPTGGPSVAEGEDEPPCCKDSDPPQERNRRNLGRVSIPVKLEVSLEGGGAHEAAVAASDISGQLADISEKLGWISKLMDVKSVGTALVRDGVGWSLAGAAAPPAAGAALGMPTPTSPGQLAVDTLSILGKISSVIIGKVPELQERRLPDCDVQGTFRYNVFKAECVEIWVCRNGQWVKDHSRFSLTLVSQSSGHMTKRRALTWAQAQRLIRRYEQMYRGRLARALDRLAQLEAGCR